MTERTVVQALAEQEFPQQEQIEHAFNEAVAGMHDPVLHHFISCWFHNRAWSLELCLKACILHLIKQKKQLLEQIATLQTDLNAAKK